jgi:hypothetical protein
VASKTNVEGNAMTDRTMTEQLRKAALATLAATGKGAVQKIHRRSLLYQLSSTGPTFRLRTNRARVLILETDGPDAEAKLYIEDADYLLFAYPFEKGTAVYWIPTPVVAAKARKDHT